MAISKRMRTVLRAITALEPNVKKSYKLERTIGTITAGLRGKPSDYKMWDHVVETDHHKTLVRLFAPEGEGPFPLLLFFHGGGWVTGGIKNYSGLCAYLASETRHMVASVDYRLAPEHKFPAAPEDCYAVAKEFFSSKTPNIDTDDITLIGDSAGGNLAAAVSLMARDRGEFTPPQQILLYPSTYNDHSIATSPFPSVRENGKGYLLTSKRIESFTELYRSSDEDLTNPYYAPLLAEDLSNQPRTLIVTAEYDPLRDEAEEYGRRLKEAGNSVQVERIRDVLHAYMMLPISFKKVKHTFNIINAFLLKGKNGG